MIRPDNTWFLALRDSSSRRTCARISSTEGGAWGSGSGSIASIVNRLVLCSICGVGSRCGVDVGVGDEGLKVEYLFNSLGEE
jgi:hypothetical protein